MQKFSPARLIAARRALGLNRDQVAFSIGRTAQMYAFYEKGKHAPPANLLPKIADRLGVTVADLFEEVEPGA